MNSKRDFDRAVDQWLDDGSDATPPEVINAVLLAARSTPQERDYRIPWRTPTMNKFVTFGFGSAAMIAIALIVGAQFFGSPGDVGSGQPTPNPDASTTEPLSSASVVPIGVEQLLNAGSYSLSEFPVGITFEIPAFEPPAEWFSCSSSPVEQAVCYVSNAEEDIPLAAVTFQIVDNVRTPPCNDQETAELLDPPVGPSVDDLVTAISNLEGYEAGFHEAVTVSGFRGMEFTLWAPDSEGCTATWATAERTTGMVPNEINSVSILDVDGVRVVISFAYHRETPEATVAAVFGIIDSVQIQP